MKGAGRHDLGRKIGGIKEKCINDMDRLAGLAEMKLRENGFIVEVAESARRAAEYIASLAEAGPPVLLAGTGVDRELDLYGFLSARGRTVVDPGEANRALRILGLIPSHPLFPLFLYEENQIYKRLKSHYGPEWVSIGDWREMHFNLLASAGTGITGCTALAAQEGTVLITEQEENAHLASTLPPVHVVVAGLDRIVHDIGEALLVARGISWYGAGRAMARNIFFISGPSATADIQGITVKGMHGPREVHVILLDNGRSSARNGPDRDLLKCMECGCCLGACRVYRERGPVFPEHRAAPFNSCWALARGGYDGECLGCGSCAGSCPLGIAAPLGR